MSGTNPIGGLILEGTTVEGSLSFEQRMRIDGVFKGEIKKGQELVVGKNAQVEGTVKVDHLIILGTVSGIVTHAQTIKVEAGGILRGEWTTHSLEVAPGAILHGKSTMKEAEPKA